jgi:hypothetical protein
MPFSFNLKIIVNHSKCQLCEERTPHFIGVPPTRSRRVVPSNEAHGRNNGNGELLMNINNLWKPPVLRRVRYFMNGEISKIFGIVFMNRAGWVFRQQPVPSHHAPETWGFEVETLRNPKVGVLVLKAAGCPTFKYTVLWERPARPGEGEGPEKSP